MRLARGWVARSSGLRFPNFYRFNAAWMALNNASGLKGLRRKSTAPPAIASVRSSSFARAEIKMIGMRLLAFVRFRCNSRPSIPGIRRSRIRIKQFVSSTRPESRNSRADENASALKPNERTRYRVESAIEASSSTMQTRGALASLTVLLGTLILRLYSQGVRCARSGPNLLDFGPSPHFSQTLGGRELLACISQRYLALRTPRLADR
jgi:hypothetical protein